MAQDREITMGSWNHLYFKWFLVCARGWNLTPAYSENPILLVISNYNAGQNSWNNSRFIPSPFPTLPLQCWFLAVVKTQGSNIEYFNIVWGKGRSKNAVKQHAEWNFLVFAQVWQVSQGLMTCIVVSSLIHALSVECQLPACLVKK